MNFDSISYYNHIRDWVETKKARGEKYSYQMMASAIGVQRPYLSKVLSGDANLSSDQVYLLLKEMTLSADEEEFFKLTWEYCRTSLFARKEELKREIEKFQKKMKRTESRLNLQQEQVKEISPELYYLNPINQIIHIALGIKELREDLPLLAKKLDISVGIINRSLKELHEAGIITWGSDIVVNKSKIHLPEKSPLFWAWKTQLNLLSLNKSKNSKQLGQDSCYNFSVVFSCDEECKSKIQSEYFDFLKKVEELVSNSAAEQVYQMNYDLINWA